MLNCQFFAELCQSAGDIQLDPEAGLTVADLHRFVRGDLHVCIKKMWVPLCIGDADDKTVTVICKQLGHPSKGW